MSKPSASRVCSDSAMWSTLSSVDWFVEDELSGGGCVPGVATTVSSSSEIWRCSARHLVSVASRTAQRHVSGFGMGNLSFGVLRLDSLGLSWAG